MNVQELESQEGLQAPSPWTGEGRDGGEDFGAAHFSFALSTRRTLSDSFEPGPFDLRRYVSEEFGAAAHLCACGCGSKVSTPLAPTEWALEETDSGPTLKPSVGNWQQACQSHYWIWRGEIKWEKKWTREQIAEGRRAEDDRRHAYYDELYRERGSFLHRFWRWLRTLFRS